MNKAKLFYFGGNNEGDESPLAVVILSATILLGPMAIFWALSRLF